MCPPKWISDIEILPLVGKEDPSGNGYRSERNILCVEGRNICCCLSFINLYPVSSTWIFLWLDIFAVWSLFFYRLDAVN